MTPGRESAGIMGDRVVFWEHLFRSAAVICGLLTLAIFCFLCVLGLPLLQDGHLLSLLSSPWAPARGLYGIFPMLLASILLALLSLALGFPVSLGCSLLITALAPRRLRMLLIGMIRLMAGIPTVVYSFAALFLLVPLMRTLIGRGSGLSLLTAAPVLALLIVPTMVIFFVAGFEKVNRAHLLALDALGGSRVQKIIHILLPGARPVLINGTLLGFGRAMGDTMVSLMLAGNSTAVPSSLADSARTLPAHIALVMASDFDSLEFTSIFACGLLLYLVTGLLMLLMRLPGRSPDNES